jgi:hypothetical protein
MSKSAFARVCVTSAVVIVGLGTSLSATHSWGNYHWARTANPFTVQAGDNVNDKWRPYLVQAISDWDASSVLNVVKVAGRSNRNCKATAGRIEVCNATYGFNGWLGIAQIWVTGGVHITQAVTKLNDSYFNTATYDSFAWRQMVACQEVGHDFGLDHQDEDFDDTNLGTCMDYTSDPTALSPYTNPPADNTRPNAHDYEQLVTIYGSHFDSTNTASATALPSAAPAAMGLLDFDTPAQWGRSVHKSANGRQEMFEFDFGQGNKVITHVFWADPANDAH